MNTTNKKYFFSLDIIRLFSFSLIIFYHFFVQLEQLSVGPKITFSNQNMRIATLGVALFFMVSGFGLFRASQSNWTGAISFFKKRVIRILIPFYIVWFAYFVYLFCLSKGWPFSKEIPPISLFFTIIGADEYFSMLGYDTFSLGIGEWFLGCLIFMYLLFPFLRICIQKKPTIFIAAITCIWVILVITHPFAPHVPPHMNFFYKLFEFILGMYLAKMYDRLPKILMVIVVPVILCFLFLPVALPIPEAARITLFSISVFLFILLLEDFIPSSQKLQKLLKIFSRYSFELYLVHHVVIYRITPPFTAHYQSRMAIVALLLIELLLMMILAKLVVSVKERIISLLGVK